MGNAPIAAAPTGLKFTDTTKTRLRGLLLPWGGHKARPYAPDGADQYDEWFSPRTDFGLSWFKASGWPLLYHHGRDAAASIDPIGHIDSIDFDPDTGGWMNARLDEQNKYFGVIRRMVEQGKMYLSSGAMGHLIDVDKKSGEIRRWILVEGSATHSPANLRATVSFDTAVRHFKSAGLDLPRDLAPPPDYRAGQVHSAATMAAFQVMHDHSTALVGHLHTPGGLAQARVHAGVIHSMIGALVEGNAAMPRGHVNMPDTLSWEPPTTTAGLSRQQRVGALRMSTWPVENVTQQLLRRRLLQLTGR